MKHWLPLALALSIPAAAQERPPATEESWFRLTLDDGTAIGHGSREVRATEGGRETISRQTLLLQESGDPVSRIVTESSMRQDAAGRVVALSETRRTNGHWRRISARIDPASATVTRTTERLSSSTVIALPPGIRFDGGAELLRDWDPDRQPTLEFHAFDLDAMAIERVTVERAAGPRMQGTDGLRLVRRRYDGATLRGVALLTLDRDRRIAAVTQPMYGAAITSRPASRQEAQAPHPPFRVLSRVTIRLPYRIADTATLGHIRYRFGFVDGITFAPPATGEQRVTPDDSGVTLDLCTDCGPGLPADAATLADARRPTEWLQSDDRRIRSMTSRIAKMRISDAEKMALVTELARSIIERPDFAGHYSALDTIRRRAGDCTEAAVLVAAFGRSIGIPTRVANGLVYSRQRYHGMSNAFLPHSWALAWVDGRWRSYDSALSGFDATHITLTIGDGDPRSISGANQLAGLLIWQSMTEVRTRR